MRSRSAAAPCPDEPANHVNSSRDRHARGSRAQMPTKQALEMTRAHAELVGELIDAVRVEKPVIDQS